MEAVENNSKTQRFNLAQKQDFTPPEAWRKRGITMNNGSLKVIFQTPLDYLFERAVVEQEQYWAGDRLYRAFIRSGLGEKHGSLMNDARGRDTDLDDRQGENELLYRECIIAVDPYERCIVRKVCCYSEWPKLDEVKLLRRGLNDLKLFWEKRDKQKKHVE